MNALLEKIGIAVPIVQAPMAGVSTPALAAAVSNAGGLGSIGVGAASAEVAREMIHEVHTATGCPFNVNVFCHRPAVADADREAAWLDRLTPVFTRYGANRPGSSERSTGASSRTTPCSPCSWKSARRS